MFWCDKQYSLFYKVLIVIWGFQLPDMSQKKKRSGSLSLAELQVHQVLDEPSLTQSEAATTDKVSVEVNAPVTVDMMTDVLAQFAKNIEAKVAKIVDSRLEESDIGTGEGSDYEEDDLESELPIPQ